MMKSQSLITLNDLSLDKISDILSFSSKVKKEEVDISSLAKGKIIAPIFSKKAHERI